jgi:hypothetical protein
MRKAYVSVIAILLLLGITAGTASANGTTTGSTFSVTASGFPDSVRPGDTMEGTVSVSMPGNPALMRVQVYYFIYVTTPLGSGLVESGSFGMRAGRTRTFNISLPVEANAVPGLHSVKLAVRVGRETLSVGHEFTVLP